MYKSIFFCCCCCCFLYLFVCILCYSWTYIMPILLQINIEFVSLIFRVRLSLRICFVSLPFGVYCLSLALHILNARIFRQRSKVITLIHNKWSYRWALFVTSANKSEPNEILNGAKKRSVCIFVPYHRAPWHRAISHVRMHAVFTELSQYHMYNILVLQPTCEHTTETG